MTELWRDIGSSVTSFLEETIVFNRCQALEFHLDEQSFLITLSVYRKTPVLSSHT